MNWKSNGITEFIQEAMDLVKYLSEEVVKTMKENLKGVHAELAKYNRPLLARKNKPVVKDEFEREHKVSFIIAISCFVGSFHI